MAGAIKIVVVTAMECYTKHMYIGVDVGGTKTLVAVLDDNGVIKEQAKFPTPKEYPAFLTELAGTIADFQTQDFQAGGVAMPGQIDRHHGRVINLGNLGWQNIPAQADLEKLCHCPFALENDAKLAGLSEAMLLKEQYRKVLYITISTGIGIALIVDGSIDTNISDGGGKTIMLEHQGQFVSWESFASGHAIVERYGKRATELEDTAAWQTISRDIAKGLIHCIAITQPEVIVIGGGVGTAFDKYAEFLEQALSNYHMPQYTLPKLTQAQRPEEAVVYGCYDLAKQVYGHAATD